MRTSATYFLSSSTRSKRLELDEELNRGHIAESKVDDDNFFAFRLVPLFKYKPEKKSINQSIKKIYNQKRYNAANMKNKRCLSNSKNKKKTENLTDKLCNNIIFTQEQKFAAD